MSVDGASALTFRNCLCIFTASAFGDCFIWNACTTSSSVSGVGGQADKGCDSENVFVFVIMYIIE